MDGVRLRQAVVDDMPGLWEVRYAVTENTLTPGRILDEELRASIEETGRGWVVEHEGVILGFAIGLAETGSVWALFVRPDAQGQGIGSALHATMIEWFATQPVPVLWLTTGTDTKARSFYEARGWRCVGDTGKGEVRYERANVS